MQPWYSVLIPTKDSAAWIGTLLRHYQARGITPTLLLDARTTDTTRAIAAALGVPVVDVHGFTHTEAIVSLAKDIVKTPWALFIHDDEVPSDALFARLAGPQPPDAAQSVALPRRWAWFEPGQPLMYGRSSHWHDRTDQPGTDHAWRLFRPDQVTYTSIMHTEGIRIDRWSRVPLEAYFVHFEWVLRSRAQRAWKLWKYDEYRWGYGKFFEKVYVPESQPPGVIEYLPFGTTAYDELAAAYYAARGPDPRIPRRSLRTQIRRLKHYIADKIRTPNFSDEASDRKGLNVKLDREVADPFNAIADDMSPAINHSYREMS
jgi:hypothetical protein